jgi:hypothetical protein
MHAANSLVYTYAQAQSNVVFHPDDETAMQYQQTVIDVPGAEPE